MAKSFKNKILAPGLQIPIYKLFPNCITIVALCIGISSVRYAMDAKMQIAAALIIIAGFMDGVDGRLARLLNSSTRFGAQLDSLADMVSFGVAPALVIYLWSLHEIPYRGVGWMVVLFYVICSVLRLARFNVQSEDKEAAYRAQYFFTGIPIPCGAGLLLLPMISTFEWLVDFRFSPYFIAVYAVIIGGLMISRIPTLSFKKVNINKNYLSLFFVLMAALIACMILEPWIVLPILELIYIMLIPYSMYLYRKKFTSTKEIGKLHEQN